MSREEALSRIYVATQITDWHVIMTYRGTPEDLIEAGAATDYLFQEWQKGHQRLDHNGDKYTCHKIRKGTARELTRYVRDMARARELPGLPANLSLDWLDFLTAHPDRVYETALSSTHRRVYGTRAALEREGLQPYDSPDYDCLNGFVYVIVHNAMREPLTAEWWRGYLWGGVTSVLRKSMPAIESFNAKECDQQLSSADIDRIGRVLSRSSEQIEQIIWDARLVPKNKPVLRLVVNN